MSSAASHRPHAFPLHTISQRKVLGSPCPAKPVCSHICSLPQALQVCGSPLVKSMTSIELKIG